MKKDIYGAIEAGGTKFICVIGRDPENILTEARFATTTPAETLEQAIDFFKESESMYGKLTSIGIASFGPLELSRNSSTYGQIKNTPKPDWSGTDLISPFQKEFAVPIRFDTDVNGAALGEWQWGAAQGLESFVYLTIGTGIGGGAMVNGKLLHGLQHPEMGHIPLPHDFAQDPFAGTCPYHGDCFEGLASGPALAQRWGQPAETLPHDHPAWGLQAQYIASALTSFMYTLSPERIIIGGGVAQQTHLLPMIRTKFKELLNGYLGDAKVFDNFIVAPDLGPRAGVMGALVLATRAIK